MHTHIPAPERKRSFLVRFTPCAKMNNRLLVIEVRKERGTVAKIHTFV